MIIGETFDFVVSVKKNPITEVLLIRVRLEVIVVFLESESPKINDISKSSNIREFINSLSENSDSAVSKFKSIDWFAHVERTVDYFHPLDIVRFLLFIVGAGHVNDQTQGASL